MSISGLHVTMFAWGAALLVGALWRRSARLCLAFPAPNAALLGGVVLAGAYAVFSGWGLPSQRTVAMLATVVLLRLSGRRWPWPQVWLLALALIVALDPWALLQAGFWLSFVAVGVLFATDAGAPEETGPRRLQDRVIDLFREQWVVTLALTPLSLLLFNQVSVVGLLANAVAIPWVTLVLTPLSMLGVLWAPVWDAAAWAVWGLSAVLRALAALPFASLFVAAAPLWTAVAGVAGGVLLAMPWPWSLRTLGLPLLLPVLLWQAPRPEAGQFALLAADIGQGNALLVRTATHTLVYDAGPRFSRESDAGHRVLVPLLRALGERVDAVVLSHRDTDHTGGAQAVLTAQPQATLLSSIGDDHALQALRPAQRCEAGHGWDWDGVRFDVLHPAADDYVTARKSNAMSCVLRITNGQRTALLTGDIEQAQEAALLGNGSPLQADVLLVPHHGSKTSSSAAFLDAVAPRFALVQSGYRNRFGHPAPPVLERYQERQIQVLDSPHCGAMFWDSARADEVLCQRELGRRYWQHLVP
jgi:competence protein ComEC